MAIKRLGYERKTFPRVRTHVSRYNQKVKTDVTTPGSYLQSQSRAAQSAKAAASKSDPKLVGDPKLLKKLDPAYKLDISGPPSSTSLPSVPVPSLPTPPVPKPSLPDAPKEEPKLDVKDHIEAPKIEEKKVPDGSVRKPLVVFIKGLDVFSSPSKSERGYAGVGRMAEAVEGARIYGWDQQNEIIEQIKKIDPNYPGVLVGHSLGGDTAIEVAESLDSLEHKFRKVDLLVTLDAVGFEHDVIPQNVKEHLNVFGERDHFLNDTPHVARRNELTNVLNILSPLDHTEIDDDKGVQFEVMSRIQKVIGKA
jgi:hypothetical protein